MVTYCERCKKEIYRQYKCNYCGRTICSSCIKSSQTATKILKLTICKDCWSNMPKRKAYKSKRLVVAQQQK